MGRKGIAGSGLAQGGCAYFRKEKTTRHDRYESIKVII